MHKFASNVVEKCLALGAPADRTMLIKLMLGSEAAGTPKDGETHAEGAEVCALLCLACPPSQEALTIQRLELAQDVCDRC